MHFYILCSVQLSPYSLVCSILCLWSLWSVSECLKCEFHSTLKRGSHIYQRATILYRSVAGATYRANILDLASVSFQPAMRIVAMVPLLLPKWLSPMSSWPPSSSWPSPLLFHLQLMVAIVARSSGQPSQVDKNQQIVRKHQQLDHYNTTRDNWKKMGKLYLFPVRRQRRRWFRPKQDTGGSRFENDWTWRVVMRMMLVRMMMLMMMMSTRWTAIKHKRNQLKRDSGRGHSSSVSKS